ncbi:DUF5071 domain-containing protein [Paenibacillus sp. MER 180]|uniref:DUF5071 domain-containing protein n=1 Tax=Paenibacillus sp. MER 180 TaxID=2939570 RepID=UPI00203FDA8D|nr:DUF5071 domain-containing protein [Paenibacillus sp. MER 180]MCM3293158.1 DUF5071 domain-containing protein [Paenibacillus sp. MER 180]
MDDLKQLLTYLHWDTPLDKFEEAKIQFKKLKDEELRILVQPIDKSHWDSAADVLIEIGYPRVHKILPDLLEWLMDINWPGANRISEFLVSIKAPLIPSIKEALNSNDMMWKYWIIECVLLKWSVDLVEQITDELLFAASESDEEAVHLSALKLLLQYKMIESKEVLNLIDSKLQDFRNRDIFEELNELKTMVLNGNSTID